MKIYFYTQEHENYGTEAEPFWKAKGGSDFILESNTWTTEMFDRVYSILNYSNPFFTSTVIGHNDIQDDFITDFEKAQLEYDGEIQFPATRITYDQFIQLHKNVTEEFTNA